MIKDAAYQREKEQIKGTGKWALWQGNILEKPLNRDRNRCGAFPAVPVHFIETRNKEEKKERKRE